MKRSDTLRDVKAALAHADAVQAYNQPKRNKYGNRKVTKIGRDGKSEIFDSVREYERHLVLLDMQKRGEIFELKRQPKFALVVGDLCICHYIGDWQYNEVDRWGHVVAHVVEDAKGFKTQAFRLKWKLCQALYPNTIWRLS